MATRSKGRGRAVGKVGSSRKATVTGKRAKPKRPTGKVTPAQKRARAKRLQEKKLLAAAADREQQERAHLAGALRAPLRSPKQLGYAESTPHAKPAPPGKPIWDIPHVAPAPRR
jgi:hypothetical protein